MSITFGNADLVIDNFYNKANELEEIYGDFDYIYNELYSSYNDYSEGYKVDNVIKAFRPQYDDEDAEEAKKLLKKVSKYDLMQIAGTIGFLMGVAHAYDKLKEKKE